MGKMPRKLSLYGVILAILLFVIFQMSSVPIQAETESPESSVDQEVSTFSNPAQAAHALNLATVAAQNVPDVQAAFAALQAAETALQNATPSDIAQAQAAYDTAKANFEAALAEAAGVIVGDIADMRSDGLGWGQIAHELGLHPGLLGLGHNKGATDRDMQAGLAIGHGVSNNGSSGGKGLGNAVGHGGSQGGGHGGGHGGGLGGGHGGGNSGGGGGHGGGGGNGGGGGGGHGK